MLISSSVCLRTVTFSPTAFWSVLTVTRLNEWERQNCSDSILYSAHCFPPHLTQCTLDSWVCKFTPVNSSISLARFRRVCKCNKCLFCGSNGHVWPQPDSILTHLTCLLSKLSKLQQNFGCLAQLHVEMEVMSDVGKMYLQISHRHIFNLSIFAHPNCGHSQSAVGGHTWR